jgi:hypothetical protein
MRSGNPNWIPLRFFSAVHGLRERNGKKDDEKKKKKRVMLALLSTTRHFLLFFLLFGFYFGKLD